MSLVYGVRAIALITNTPGSAGTSAVVSTGQGARFAANAAGVPRYARIWEISNPGNVEVVTYTRSTDTFTIVRNVDSGGAINIQLNLFVIEDVDDLMPYYPVPFDTGFFEVVTGGGTWTVSSGGVLRHAAKLVGHMLHYEIVASGTIAGTVSAVKVRFPLLLTPSGALDRGGKWPISINNAGTDVGGTGFWLAGANGVTCARLDGANFTAGTLFINFQFQVELP